MYFFYDQVNLKNATLTSGDISGGSFSSGSNPSGRYNLIDESLEYGVTTMGSYVIKIALTSAADPDSIATYISSANTGGVFSLQVYGSNSDTVGSSKSSVSNESSGWDIDTITYSTAYSNWFIESDNPMDDKIFKEVMFGKQLTFDTRPDTSINEGRATFSNIKEAYSGKQFATRLSDTKKTWTLTWSNISSSFKDDLITMRDTVSLDLPFIFNDDSNSYYVRMESGLDMTEVAHQRFSTSINLIEQ